MPRIKLVSALRFYLAHTAGFAALAMFALSILEGDWNDAILALIALGTAFGLVVPASAWPAQLPLPDPDAPAPPPVFPPSTLRSPPVLAKINGFLFQSDATLGASGPRDFVRGLGLATLTAGIVYAIGNLGLLGLSPLASATAAFLLNEMQARLSAPASPDA